MQSVLRENESHCFPQVDDIEEKLERLLGMYEEDRKRFAMLSFASPHCPPCTPMASSPSPPYNAYQMAGQPHHHLPINTSAPGVIKMENSWRVCTLKVKHVIKYAEYYLTRSVSFWPIFTKLGQICIEFSFHFINGFTNGSTLFKKCSKIFIS